MGGKGSRFGASCATILPMSEEATTDERRLVRGEPVVRKVLMATMEEVALTGYDGLTIERVAARAGVNRTTIYRRWPTKKELVTATVQLASEQIQFDWDLGSLRADLKELLRRATEALFTPGMLGMHRMMLEAAHEPALQEISRCVQEDKQAHALAMLKRAEARGEFRADLDKTIFLDALFGGLFMRVVAQHQPLTTAYVADLLEYLLKIAAPGASAPKARARAAARGKAAPHSPRAKKRTQHRR